MGYDFKNFALDNLLKNMPGIIWIKDENFCYVACNQSCKFFIGARTGKIFLGRSDYDLPWDKYAEIYREGDQLILHGKTLTFLHPVRTFDNKELIILTKKSPFYDSNHQIVGITGYITIVASPAIVSSMTNTCRFDSDIIEGKNNRPVQYILDEDLARLELTKQEINCLFLLVRGKSAKEIANHLFLSIRTIEKHLEKIRLKLKCNSRSEVIDKAISVGFINIIPSDFLIEIWGKTK